MMYGELSSYGIIHHKFEKEELKFLYEEVNFLKDNFSKATPANDELVGHIVNEYYLSGKTTGILQEMMMPLIQEYDARWPNFLARPFFDRDVAIGLKDAWVNFQKKYEYNPVHDHSGIFSFVWYLDIPEEIRQEHKNSKGNTLSRGCIEFSSIFKAASRMRLNPQTNDLLIFASQHEHQVYPFYSDNTRISLAGNIYEYK